jgi:hypothetical protein
MSSGKPKPKGPKAPGTAGLDRPRTLAELDEAGATAAYFLDLALAINDLLPDRGDGSGKRCEFVLLVGGAKAGGTPRLVSSIHDQRAVRDLLAEIVRTIDQGTLDPGIVIRESGGKGGVTIDTDRKAGRQPLPRQPGAGDLPPRQKFPKAWLPADYDTDSHTGDGK